MFGKKRPVPTELDRIAAANNPVIIVPFHGDPITVVVRELTQAQLLACGEFSLIETFQDKINKKKLNKKTALRSIIEYSEAAHRIMRKTLVKPTYDEIIETISDENIEDKLQELKEIEGRLAIMNPSPKRTELQQEVWQLKAFAELILPEDFTSTVISYILRVDRSDIKELTEEALLHAAILADRGHNNPADHVNGNFTDYMKDDINRRAWIIYEDWRKERKNGG